MQTNLWRMAPKKLSLKCWRSTMSPSNRVSMAPQEITDSQRGDGYFNKTMHGYEIARPTALVRFICKFTNKSVKQREDLQFFQGERVRFETHPALPSLRSENPKEWALEPGEYGDLLIYLLDKSLENLGTMEVMNINDLCRCVFTRRGECLHVR